MSWILCNRAKGRKLPQPGGTMSKFKHDVPEALLANLLANYKNPEDLIDR